MMAYQDHVRSPLRWAMKPVSSNTIWLTKTDSQGKVMLVIGHVCKGTPRSFVHSSKIHAQHFGILACINCLGNTPILENVFRTQSWDDLACSAISKIHTVECHHGKWPHHLALVITEESPGQLVGYLLKYPYLLVQARVILDHHCGWQQTWESKNQHL